MARQVAMIIVDHLARAVEQVEEVRGGPYAVRRGCRHHYLSLANALHTQG